MSPKIQITDTADITSLYKVGLISEKQALELLATGSTPTHQPVNEGSSPSSQDLECPSEPVLAPSALSEVEFSLLQLWLGRLTSRDRSKLISFLTAESEAR